MTKMGKSVQIVSHVLGSISRSLSRRIKTLTKKDGEKNQNTTRDEFGVMNRLGISAFQLEM